MGIEPTQPAWEAGVLPLNYICEYVAILPHKPYFVNVFCGFEVLFQEHEQNADVPHCETTF